MSLIQETAQATRQQGTEATSNQQLATGNLQPATGNLQPATKTITWPTNYNNKLTCSGFIHIDLVPFKKPVRSEVEKTIIEIYTADHSHPPVKVSMWDMLYIKLTQLPCYMTLSSHGMDELEFAQFICNKYPDRLSLYSEVAVYFYKKIN